MVILGSGFAAAPEAAVLDLLDPEAPGQPEATAQPDATAQPEAPSAAATQPSEASSASDGTYPGPVVTNLRGDYQLQIVVVGGEVTDVQFLTAGTDAAQSVAVNAMALPLLREEILEAQDWDVDYVSGASYTSPAMIESAQGAFDDAGL